MGGGGSGGRVGGVRVDVNEELKFFVKIQENNWGVRGSGGGVGLGEGGQGVCDRRIEVFWKIHKKMGGSGGRVGGSGLCGGIRVDVNEELKFL